MDRSFEQEIELKLPIKNGVQRRMFLRRMVLRKLEVLRMVRKRLVLRRMVLRMVQENGFLKGRFLGEW